MDTTGYIQVKLFCHHHNIESSFIDSLHGLHLIDIEKINDEDYLLQQQLPDIEKLLRLHEELDINAEGLHAIFHLLQKMESMQQEIEVLKNRLRLYE